MKKFASMVILLFSFLSSAFAGTLTTASTSMDSSNQAAWWSPIVEYNGNSYLAFNAPGSASGKHRVRVAKRVGSTWTSDCLKSNGSCVEYDDDIGHSQPSIAIDGDGHLHLFVSMHHVNWRYFRSNTPENVTDIVSRSSEMPDNPGNYTYPVLARAGNDVFLIIRAQGSNGRPGRLYRWSNAAKQWTRIASFAYEAGKTAYPDDIKADSNGDLHITWEWLGLNGGGPIRHAGSYLRYRPSTNQFFTAAGNAVATPVTPSTAGVVFQPLTANESFATDCNTGCESNAGYQSGKLAVDPSTNRPQIVYRHKPTPGGFWTVKRARWTGSAWSLETLYDGAYDTYAALGLTHNGTTARAYFVKKSPVGGDKLHVAEKSSTGSWVTTPLNGSTSIERISVIRRSDGTDVMYLSNPSQQILYYQTHAR
jgi:hypothetical protein